MKKLQNEYGVPADVMQMCEEIWVVMHDADGKLHEYPYDAAEFYAPKSDKADDFVDWARAIGCMHNPLMDADDSPAHPDSNIGEYGTCTMVKAHAIGMKTAAKILSKKYGLQLTDEQIEEFRDEWFFKRD